MSLLKAPITDICFSEANVNGRFVTLKELLALKRFMANGHQSLAATTQIYGQHTLSQRARGIEFSELRQYVAGDDIRTIDWRQTAKRGRAYRRDYQDEHARTILFVVDLGPSMRFGTRCAFKSVIAARVAALLIWQSVAMDDVIGGAVWGVNQQAMLPPQGQHQGALALLKQIALASQLEPKQMSLTDQLSHISQQLQQGSELVIISDFSNLESNAERQLKTISRQAELKLIHIYDVFEQAPPLGRFWLANGSSYAELNLYSEDVRKAYLKPFVQRLAALRNLSHQLGAPLLSLSTQDNISQNLSLFSNKGLNSRKRM